MVFSHALILVLLFGVVLDGVRHTLKVLERHWRLTPGFVLLYWKKPSLLIIRATHYLYSSQQRITFVMLNSSQIASGPS